MVSMIRFPEGIATTNSHIFITTSVVPGRRAVCYTAALPDLTDMKRVLPVLVLSLTLSANLAANPVNGTVAFASRRGQQPVMTETLVWLEPLSARTPPRRSPESVRMVTRGKMLMPHVIAIPVGSTVSFPNEDPISHNLFSLSSGNSFDLGLYRKGAGKSEKFDTPGLVNVYCNVHPNMSAVIHVMSTPYYTFADAAGKFSVDVPPGRYRLIVWNELGGTTDSAIEVGPNGVNGNVALVIDSRNFRQQQHRNKMGQPYAPPSTRDY